jgi:hypothetical protein
MLLIEFYPLNIVTLKNDKYCPGDMGFRANETRFSIFKLKLFR